MSIIYRKFPIFRRSPVSPQTHINIILGEITALLLFFLVMITSNTLITKQKKILAKQEGAVLGTTFENDDKISPSSVVLYTSPTKTPPPPTIIISPSSPPTQTPTPLPKKQWYSIAIIGDSAIDTMGENTDYLNNHLKEKYPHTSFFIYNYGKGSENIQEGLDRFDKSFEYKTRKYPSIPKLKPDILIVGSFSYNPFSPHDPNKHWNTLAKLVREAKKVSKNVYMFAEIAPIKRGFGKGPNGLNWKDDDAYEHATHIIEQLDNTVKLAKTLGVPIINAFKPSQFNLEKEGKKQFISLDDGVHPSLEGHEFMADIIASEIQLDR